MPKKKIIKTALLLLALWIFLDWFHLSGREIGDIGRMETADEVSVWYDYRVVTALDKHGYPAEHGMEREQHLLNPAQIEQLKELLKEIHAHWCFQQTMVSSAFDRTVPLGEIDHTVDGYDIRACWHTGGEIRITTDFGEFLQYNGTIYRMIGKDWNSRMAEILAIE